MKKKLVLAMITAVTLTLSSVAIPTFAEGNTDTRDDQMNMNNDQENYGEGPMNINEDDGPLRVNDDDNDRARINAAGEENDTNWEWIGLLGLAGLLGLRKRDREATR